MAKISALAIVQNYIEDSDLQEQIDESLLIRWTTDYDSLVGLVEDLSPKITHLYVDGFKAQLPEGFRKVSQISARKKVDKTCTRKETVNKWVSTKFVGCEIEAELTCNQCGSCDDCGCQVPTYEIDIDRQWEISNPQYYLKGWHRAGTIGKGPGLIGNESDEWMLLRPALNDFYLNKYFLNDCLNFMPQNPCNYSFRIEEPNILVDFPEGEIIISYLGKTLDEDGDIMVEDDAHYLEGLIAHLDYKWWAREAKRHAYSGKTNMRLFKQYSQAAKQERAMAISRYKARKVVPDYKEFKNFMEKHFLQRIPNRQYDMGGKQGLNTEIFKSYGNLLEYGDRTKRYYEYNRFVR